MSSDNDSEAVKGCFGCCLLAVVGLGLVIVLAAMLKLLVWVCRL